MPSKTNFSEVDTSYFTSDAAVGGFGGGVFSFGCTKQPDSDILVRSLKFWYRQDGPTRGVEVGLSNGDSFFAGERADDSADVFYFDEITSIKMWDYEVPVPLAVKLTFADSAIPHIKRMGGLRIVAKSSGIEKTLEFNAKSDEDAYSPNVGSGLLYGVFGRGGADIDCLGFALLHRQESTVISDVKYSDWPENNEVPITPKVLNTIDHTNETSETQTFQLSGTTSIQQASTWSFANSTEKSLSATASISASIPSIADISASVTGTLTEGSTSTHEQSKVKTEERSYQFQVNIAPGKRVIAKALIYEGRVDLSFSGMLVCKLVSGRSFQYPVKGGYKGVPTSKVVVKEEEI